MLNSLQQLFPNSILNPDQASIQNDHFYLLTLENQLIAIPKKDLSSSEKALLDLINEHSVSAALKKSHWQNFLEKISTNMPIISGDLQIIYLNFKKSPQYFDTTLWFTTLKEAIPNVIEWFKHSDHQFHVLIKIKKIDDQLWVQIQSIIQILDGDFDTVTRATAGFIHSLSSHLPDLYQNELSVVEHGFLGDHPQPFNTLSTLLLNQISWMIPKEFILLSPLKQIISTNIEYVQLIQTLFENQGNLSQTAEKLYIHRNTLTYRLQKFYKETGMQLQQLSDLIICYICLP